MSNDHLAYTPGAELGDFPEAGIENLDNNLDSLAAAGEILEDECAENFAHLSQDFIAQMSFAEQTEMLLGILAMQADPAEFEKLSPVFLKCRGDVLTELIANHEFPAALRTQIQARLDNAPPAPPEMNFNLVKLPNGPVKNPYGDNSFNLSLEKAGDFVDPDNRLFIQTQYQLNNFKHDIASLGLPAEVEADLLSNIGESFQKGLAEKKATAEQEFFMEGFYADEVLTRVRALDVAGLDIETLELTAEASFEENKVRSKEEHSKEHRITAMVGTLYLIKPTLLPDEEFRGETLRELSTELVEPGSDPVVVFARYGISYESFTETQKTEIMSHMAEVTEAIEAVYKAEAARSSSHRTAALIEMSKLLTTSEFGEAKAVQALLSQGPINDISQVQELLIALQNDSSHGISPEKIKELSDLVVQYEYWEKKLVTNRNQAKIYHQLADEISVADPSTGKIRNSHLEGASQTTRHIGVEPVGYYKGDLVQKFPGTDINIACDESTGKYFDVRLSKCPNREELEARTPEAAAACSAALSGDPFASPHKLMEEAKKMQGVCGSFSQIWERASVDFEMGAGDIENIQRFAEALSNTRDVNWNQVLFAGNILRADGTVDLNAVRNAEYEYDGQKLNLLEFMAVVKRDRSALDFVRKRTLTA